MAYSLALGQDALVVALGRCAALLDTHAAPNMHFIRPFAAAIRQAPYHCHGVAHAAAFAQQSQLATSAGAQRHSNVSDAPISKRYFDLNTPQLLIVWPCVVQPTLMVLCTSHIGKQLICG